MIDLYSIFIIKSHDSIIKFVYFTDLEKKYLQKYSLNQINKKKNKVLMKNNKINSKKKNNKIK